MRRRRPTRRSARRASTRSSATGERAGVKFADSAELIGFPVQVVVGARGAAGGTVELKTRASRERIEVPVDGVVAVGRLSRSLRWELSCTAGWVRLAVRAGARGGSHGQARWSGGRSRGRCGVLRTTRRSTGL